MDSLISHVIVDVIMNLLWHLRWDGKTGGLALPGEGCLCAVEVAVAYLL